VDGGRMARRCRTIAGRGRHARTAKTAPVNGAP
jgi:hypothetical protein